MAARQDKHLEVSNVQVSELGYVSFLIYLDDVFFL